MINLPSEYGFWALAIIIAITASQAAGAVWARTSFLRLARLAIAASQSLDVSAEEKRVAANMMKMATAWYSTPAFIVAIPFVAIYISARAIYLAISGQGVTESKLLGQFPKPGKFNQMINLAFWKSRPLVTLWGLVWMLPVLLVLAFTQGSTRLVPALIGRVSQALFTTAANH